MIPSATSRERVAHLAAVLGLEGRRALVERKPATETWRIGGHYLRVTSEAVEFETIRTFHTLFAEVVRVPRLLIAEHVSGRFCLVFEGLSEPPVRWVAKWLPAPTFLEACADVLSSLSRVRQSMDALPRYARFESVCEAILADHETYLACCRDPDRSAIVAFVRRGLRHQISRDLSLVHGDFGPNNLLWSADGVAVIDLASACWGDPYADLAAAYLELCRGRRSVFERLLSHVPDLEGGQLDAHRLSAHLCLLHVRRRRPDRALRIVEKGLPGL